VVVRDAVLVEKTWSTVLLEGHGRCEVMKQVCNVIMDHVDNRAAHVEIFWNSAPSVQVGKSATEEEKDIFA
jgi:hypothetical protein